MRPHEAGWVRQVLVVGTVCYLIDVLALCLVPDLGQQIAAFIVIPSAIAEVSTCCTCS